MVEGGTTALTAKLNGEPLTVSFDGNATFGDKPQFAGDTKLDVPSVRKLSAWLAIRWRADKGFGPLSIAGHVSYTGDTFAFQNADLKFDAIHATGGIKGDLSGKVPYVNASLDTDNLDCDPTFKRVGQGRRRRHGRRCAPASASAGWSTIRSMHRRFRPLTPTSLSMRAKFSSVI